MALPIVKSLTFCVVASCVGSLVVVASHHDKQDEATTTSRTSSGEDRRHRFLSSSKWFQKYDAYPPYCATPEEMSRRAIPPLPEATVEDVGESQLKHVTAIIRHGSRTPWKRGLTCWDGYMTNPQTAVWNCSLTTLSLPPPSNDVHDDNEYWAYQGNSFLFDKNYNALMTPQYDLSNWLNGTCQLGQLLLAGYEQELTNGEHLRNAYVFDGSSFDHDPRMRLLDTSNNGYQANYQNTGRQKYVWEDIFYRVDDEQRTIMSGQVIIRGLLEAELTAYYKEFQQYPILPLHTADYDLDLLTPNEGVCPRLAEMHERFQRSTIYQDFIKSKEVQLMQEFQHKVLGIPEGTQMDAIDCLMTTMCTDRPLPKAVDDYKKNTSKAHSSASSNETTYDHDYYGTNMFQRLLDYDTKKSTMHYLANQNEYAKLGMAPLWVEIMANVYGIMEEASHTCCPPRPVPKLALFSGHDTTLIPLLASIDAWDGVWAYYASMLVIELHEINIDGQALKKHYTTNYAFRLIYNGEVITDRLRGCPSGREFCDAQILVSVVESFATLDRPCGRAFMIPHEYVGTVQSAEKLFSSIGGILLFLFLLCLGVLSGALLSYFIVEQPFSKIRRSDKDGIMMDPDGDVAMSTIRNGESAYQDLPPSSERDMPHIQVI